MNTKATIRKVLFAMLWISIGGGMLTLLIAAIGKKNKELCSNYTISIKSNQDNFFIDEKDITKLLSVAVGRDIKGKKITEFNLRQLEQLLEDNVWIRNAELWFDNRDVLHVLVIEREPIARIFTNTGTTFYIDSNEVKMPLSDKISARVPVFTDFPDKQMLSAKDSLLLHDVKNTALFIRNDPFWMSQVAQIEITEQQNFEMIPVVGNHVVKLGNGGNIDKKFNRLMIFYKQVLSQVGFDVYSTVDVQYAGQVVGTKKGTEKFIADTATFRQNAALLIKQNLQMKNETEVNGGIDLNATDLNAAKSEKPVIKNDSLKTNKTSLRATSTHSTNPNNVKTVSLPKPNEKKSVENKPKAVMPKKNL
jgi:cell division protein FtsQ